MTQCFATMTFPAQPSPTVQVQAVGADGKKMWLTISRASYDAMEAQMVAQAKVDAARLRRQHARLLKTAWWWLEELILDFSDTVLTVGPDGQWTPHPQAPVEEGYGAGFERTYPGAAVRKLLKMGTLVVIEHDENGKPLVVRAPADGDDE